LAASTDLTIGYPRPEQYDTTAPPLMQAHVDPLSTISFLVLIGTGVLYTQLAENIRIGKLEVKKTSRGQAEEWPEEESAAGQDESAAREALANQRRELEGLVQSKPIEEDTGADAQEPSMEDIRAAEKWSQKVLGIVGSVVLVAGSVVGIITAERAPPAPSASDWGYEDIRSYSRGGDGAGAVQVTDWLSEYQATKAAKESRPSDAAVIDAGKEQIRRMNAERYAELGEQVDGIKCLFDCPPSKPTQ